ncbi:fimbria/pilus periplasmic chaperone [Rhodanobacter sp. L36]|uniref:fimbrial biogenesis chaperone n=1 Tax=Rhodanobacter sp. L36 TaxID=1747221 RepID=UPI00131CFDC4|nr:fimbria/pilus periplasmic chaperone [Rhodanobacter sp. L36]
MKTLPLLVFALGLALGLTQPSEAASLRISPIGIDMSAAERAASMTLVNTGADPVNLQLRVFKWTQVHGEEVLEPATDMLISPPAATIPAGASYTVRVARQSVASVQSELSYRVFIDELPKPIDPHTLGQGVAMVLRTSLPVFVVDPNAYAKLSWKVWQDASGVHAEAINSGLRHAKIIGLTVQPEGGASMVFGAGLNGYVLAGAQKRFDLQLDPKAKPLVAGTALKLTAHDGGEMIQESVHVESR